MKIIVHIACDEINGYVEYCSKALRLMARDPQNIEVVCRTDDVKTIKPDGSKAHGTLLAKILAEVTDGNIHVVCDADTVIVKHGWDALVREELLKFDCFGAPYEDINGHSSGTGKIQTYKHIPTFVFIALRPGPPWHLLDVLPRKDDNIKITDVDLSATYNLPMGYEVFCDGGWKLPTFLRDNGLTSLSMVHLKADTLGCSVIKNLRDQSAINCYEEYHFKGEPFVMHQRSSRKHPFRAQRFSSNFYDAIEDYVPLLRPTTLGV